MHDEQEIKGDPNHPFVLEMNEISVAKAKIRKKISTFHQRRGFAESHGNSNLRWLQEQQVGIPPECLKPFEIDARHFKISAILSGSKMPSLEEVRQFGLYHGIVEEELKAFLARGEKYIDACVAAAKRSDDKDGPKFSSSGVKNLSRLPLKKLLEKLLDRRRWDVSSGRGEMVVVGDGQPKPPRNTNGPIRSFGPGVLKEQLDCSGSALELVSGKRPNFSARGSNVEGDTYYLNELLDKIDATSDERALAYKALERVWESNQKRGMAR